MGVRKVEGVEVLEEKTGEVAGAEDQLMLSENLEELDLQLVQKEHSYRE